MLNMIETMKENKKKFSLLDRKRAQKARDLQDILNVNTKELLSVIDNNHLPNCLTKLPSDPQGCADSQGHSWTECSWSKGKTIQRLEEHVQVKISLLPQQIADKYMRVTLSADIMFVNGVWFFMTIARHIQFVTCEMIADVQKQTLVTHQ